MKRLIKLVSIITLAMIAVFGVSASVAQAQYFPIGNNLKIISADVKTTLAPGEAPSFRNVVGQETRDGSNAEQSEGFNVQGFVAKASDLSTKGYLQSLNATYDSVSKTWSGVFTPITESGNYVMDIVLYCSQQNGICANVYSSGAGNGAGQFVYKVNFTIGFPSTTPTTTPSTPTSTNPLPPAPTTTPTTVTGLYQKYLARTPDAAGLAYWLGQPLDQVKAGILSSTEYASRRIQIARLYYQILHRPADIAGLDYWANNGLTIDQIRQGILSSQEYQTQGQTQTQPASYSGSNPNMSGGLCPVGYVCSPIGSVTSPQCPAGYTCIPTTAVSNPISTPTQIVPTTYTPTSVTTSDEVRQAYRDILDRDPALDGDSAGLQAWTGIGLTDSQLRSGISSSFEGQTKARITSMFQQILGRAPAGTELNDWYMKAYNHNTGALNLDIVRSGLAGTAIPTATPVPVPVTVPAPVMPVTNNPVPPPVPAPVPVVTPAPTPTPVPAPTPVTTRVTSDQVAQLYTSLLYRTGNTSELSYWVNSGMSIDAIRSSISAGIEATTKAKIAALYQSLLNRVPDVTGMTNWYTLAQQNNYNTDVVKAGIMQSPEYLNLHPSTTVPVTTTKTNQTISIFDAIKNLFGF